MKVIATRTVMLGGSDFTQCAKKVLRGMCEEQLAEATQKSVLKNDYVLSTKAKDVKETFSLDGLDEMIVEADFYGVDDDYFTGEVEKATIVDSYKDLMERYTAFVDAFFACVALPRRSEA